MGGGNLLQGVRGNRRPWIQLPVPRTKNIIDNTQSSGLKLTARVIYNNKRSRYITVDLLGLGLWTLTLT